MRLPTKTQSTSTLLDLSLICFVSIYLIASHLPELSTGESGEASHLDKLLHFLVYFSIASMMMLCSLHRRTHLASARVNWSLIAASLILISVLDEVSQPWVGRTFDWFDLFADWSAITLNLICFAVIDRLYAHRFRKRVQ